MRLYIKYDINAVFKKIIQDQLEKLGLTYTILGLGEVDINETVSSEMLFELNVTLRLHGCEVVENHKSILVQKTKDVIMEMVYVEENLPSSKISSYLADKLGHSYGYLSNLFSELTYTSIGNFIILQKTERAKQLIITNDFTFTEIAWKLNYSSIAHFSSQFKNATGLTPSIFQRIMNKKRNIPILENINVET
jgi:AraC-like DNA-binding protein